jgi:hypothetical protein
LLSRLVPTATVIPVRKRQRENHDFLVGTWEGAAGGPEGRDVAGLTEPLRPAEVDRARAFLLGYPGVTAIRGLLFAFVGPGRIWIVARVDVDDRLSGAQVESLVCGIESGLKREAEEVYRVDVVPIGGAQAGDALGARPPPPYDPAAAMTVTPGGCTPLYGEAVSEDPWS